MKKLLLVLLMTQPMMAITIHVHGGRRNQHPAPIKTHTDFLKRYVSNSYMRMGIMGAAFGLCATDNPLRRNFMRGMNSVQQTFNKANEVTQRAYTLERNMKVWADHFHRVAFE